MNTRLEIEHRIGARIRGNEDSRLEPLNQEWVVGRVAPRAPASISRNGARGATRPTFRFVARPFAGRAIPVSLAASRRSEQAFTMVEIAIALGVIGFALVAIIGILPSGLQVQRDNKAETIINQDATFWLETLGSGAKGVDELTNYVESIEVIERDPNTLNVVGTRYYTFGGASIPQEPSPIPFFSGQEVVGILTTQAWVTNKETSADVWAISGAAAEKDLSAASRELAFKYRLDVQIERATNSGFALSFNTLATNFSNLPQNQPPEPLDSLFHLRVRLEYPLVGGTQPPARRKSYRTLVSRNVQIIDPGSPGLGNPGSATNFFFVP